jgi:putative endonuclease
VVNVKENSHERGKRAELAALLYLKSNKLELLEQNYRGSGGEIDLIMLDDNIIVFVEVRYRSNNNYAGAIESVDRRKCERIIKTSQKYLQKHRWTAGNLCRFDVITISGNIDKPEIGWIKNAFQA